MLDQFANSSENLAPPLSQAHCVGAPSHPVAAHTNLLTSFLSYPNPPPPLETPENSSNHSTKSWTLILVVKRPQLTDRHEPPLLQPILYN